MDNGIEWRKPSGTTITTNDHPDNIAMAESQGWKRAGEKPAAKKKAPVKKPAAKADPVEEELKAFLNPDENEE